MGLYIVSESLNPDWSISYSSKVLWRLRFLTLGGSVGLRQTARAAPLYRTLPQQVGNSAAALTSLPHSA